jgi:hypothetical protein
MAIKSSKSGFPEFFADTNSAENARRQFIDAPLEAAKSSAYRSALDLARMLSLLPDAFAASQRRELKRMKRSVPEDDSRLATLEASIEQAEVLRTTARHGAVRAQRSLAALASRRDIFHGFVSDSELNPLEGLTVKLSRGREGNTKDPSATTDKDGYFSMPLDHRKITANEVEITPEHIAELFAQRVREASDGEQTASESVAVRVEILKKAKLLQEDSIPLALDRGSVYREYVISEHGAFSATDFHSFLSKPRTPDSE